MKSVMVTGASGFVGTALCQELVRQGFDVVGAVRREKGEVQNVTYLEADLADPSAFSDDFPTVDCLIHLAGRAHVLSDKASDPLSAFREVNRDATVRLARRALKAGVKRFVFVSSIGVNGNFTEETPFTEQSPVKPHAAYAVSKYEAELELTDLLRNTAMELVIVRPPLIYAENAPGNFGRLLRLVFAGVPLPLRSVRNARSLISRRNFVDFLILCVTRPQAAGELFLVADGVDVTTRQMIETIGKGMNQDSRLFIFPLVLLKVILSLIGKKSMYEQLCGSLQVDASKARQLLGWRPVESTVSALFEVGRAYKERIVDRK
ncbi:NAD-dependent epimerase/dehydratase family protein [Pseudomonas asiatica]|uniref:NAD-dependent epimerase/dehydratase family protein n=1 Tax=Pseudomonas asiatica TaxID=2219225 RepID=UPI0034580A33